MEPSTKKRRLAPKVEPQPHHAHSPPFPHDQAHAAQPQHYTSQDAPPNPQRNDFESFARHLQDAAMLIYNQTQKSPYASASVLMLRWEDDSSVDTDMTAIEQVLRDRYCYRTERWNIPTIPNPSIKLSVQIASFLENARPDHLLVLYYAGHGYVGSDNQLYWACNSRDDSAKLKWDGVRCLFEDAQSDILLLLDTCGPRESPVAGSHGTKLALAACTPEQSPRETGSRSFTGHLAEALSKLSNGRPFNVQRLLGEVSTQKQHEVSQAHRLSNGAAKGPSQQEATPYLVQLTAGKPPGIILAPLKPKTEDGQQSNDDTAKVTGAISDLMFEEPRALVCTTFVGDASPDMSSFHQWIHNAPAVAPNITVEGMFIGPPTILIISMPQSVWNVVQNEKVCLFLGHITTHNITHLYQKLIGSVSKEMEDGRILLEARQAAAATPAHRRSLEAGPGDVPARNTSESVPPGSVPAGLLNLSAAAADGKDEVEDSAEMQEAAEQLKALSHVRHLSDGSPATAERTLARLADSSLDIRHDDTGSSHEANDSGADESHEFSTPSRPPKARRTLLKQGPKQETRCNLCSHAPFKDSSSLRKHIAAAHTRPFPCAFSFAGCTSTFGSKNEWKRHIASQHLCLQFYRCSSCPQNAVEGKGNEFNRKDLFTQHLRRMHAPFAIKKALTKGDSKLQLDWENHVKEMQQTCLVTRRKPPQRSACPKTDCQSAFEGPGSWDEWTEHVGRHMEKGEGQRLGVDRLLAKWALDEGIIERKDDGEYRLCSGNGAGDRDVNTSVYYTEPKPESEERPPAEATAPDDKMVVDE